MRHQTTSLTCEIKHCDYALGIHVLFYSSRILSKFQCFFVPSLHTFFFLLNRELRKKRLRWDSTHLYVYVSGITNEKKNNFVQHLTKILMKKVKTFCRQNLNSKCLRCLQPTFMSYECATFQYIFCFLLCT